MKKILAAMIALAAVGAQAAVLYDNTTQTASRYNAGAGVITYDDVLVPTSRNPSGGPMRITRVDVGIRRVAGAVDVDLFWSGINTAATPTVDGPNYIGTANLGAVTASVTTVISATNPSGLFTVYPNNTLVAGFSAFAIGVRFSTSDTLNGWRVTNGPDANIDGFWNYGGPGNQGFFFFGGTPAATFYVHVEGEPVPEPASMAALGLGFVGILAARRRKAA